MTKIKVLSNASQLGVPEVEARPGFVFAFDPSCADYDWLVVFDEMPFDDRGTYAKGREILACPSKNTILATWEPVSIKSYSKAYTRQFGYLLTNRPREAEKHPGYRLGRGYFPAYHGHTLEELAEIPAKTKTISAVCSAKQMKHTQHFARYRLVSTLAKEVVGFDWFGFGVKPLAKKYDALDAYKYHVTVENHVAPHHWTEKFADAILCECLPFYAGDPVIDEVFPKECYIPIPIDDPAEATRIVREAIASGEYEKRRGAILEAKKLMMEKYNFFDQILEVIRGAQAEDSASRGEKGKKLYARRTVRWHSLSGFVEDLLTHTRQLFGRRGK